MPATFQKTIDKTLESVKSKFAILDDILIITKGSLNQHEQEIDKVLNLIDNKNLVKNLQKCEFAKPNFIWLGFKIHPNGIIRTQKNCDAIAKLEIPITLKQLRSFMGCIHHQIKFTPNLVRQSELCYQKATSNHKIKAITENKLFDVKCPTRVPCHASNKSLGLCLEQLIG